MRLASSIFIIISSLFIITGCEQPAQQPVYSASDEYHRLEDELTRALGINVEVSGYDYTDDSERLKILQKFKRSISSYLKKPLLKIVEDAQSIQIKKVALSYFDEQDNSVNLDSNLDEFMLKKAVSRIAMERSFSNSFGVSFNSHEQDRNMQNEAQRSRGALDFYMRVYVKVASANKGSIDSLTDELKKHQIDEIVISNRGQDKTDVYIDRDTGSNVLLIKFTTKPFSIFKFLATI